MKSSPKRREVEVTPEQRAIIYLAGILEANPFTDYNVEKTVLDILGLEPATKKPKRLNK